MRGRLLSTIVALSITVACHRTAPLPTETLSPTVLTFDDVYLGASSGIDLDQFTLNGQPLVDATFSLPDGHDPVFGLLGVGPLSSPPRLVFEPRIARDYSVVLFVSTPGTTYPVQVHGKGLAQLKCKQPPDICSSVSFDPDTGECVRRNLSDGPVCGTSDCVGDEICQSGTCTYVRRSNAPPLCQRAASTSTLQPAWTVAADPGRTLLFSGVADADGNLYLFDCPGGISSSRTCDVLSVSPEGEQRWRAATSDTFRVSAQDQLSVIGHHLFVTGTVGEWRLFVRRLSDGGEGWQPDSATPLSSLTAAGPSLLAALISNPDPTMSSPVLLIDADTGVEQSRLQDILPGTGIALVSDGQGTLYASSVTFDRELGYGNTITAVNIDDGVLWRTTGPGLSTVQATDGTRVYDGDGRVLSAADGKLLYAERLGDLVLNVADAAGFTTTRGPGASASCQDANLRRIRLADGVEESGCRLEEDDAALEILTPLALTQDGGAAFLAMKYPTELDPKALMTLWWVDRNGNARYNALLDGMVMQNPWISGASPAVVGNRWVMNGWVAPDRSAVVAYDVPGLALAEHGWINPGGNQARNSAPW